MINQIYPPELKLNKANASDTEARFLVLHFVSSKIYDTCDYFDFDIVNFPFWMEMFHAAPLMECIFLKF